MTQATIEHTLEEIWRDVLDLPEVNADEGFLEHGGDSIAATLCVIRVQETFGTELPIERLLGESMTIPLMAAEILTLRNAAGAPA